MDIVRPPLTIKDLALPHLSTPPPNNLLRTKFFKKNAVIRRV
ncbi:hypothetical protein AAJ76_8900013255 [Vairimorpha ceranae]|uniref:Uncharacterized protein n=1 Tax=Vairimorpha ceranae TaxID=40302 RepID=A0A0F9WBL7_9MICR|nr:hypothetical protein AAJ76_8900013255 [Vairimorpha ceranae]KKO74275.1 hypothetical protein AAJ76_8900013255 [Vairimorpha ceranae]